MVIPLKIPIKPRMLIFTGVIFKLNNMKTIKIEIPEGYEIDVENSDLAKGIIATKKIDRQLPKTWDEFCKDPLIKTPTWNSSLYCKSNYLAAFTALSKLITLRDEYNGEPLENWQKWDGNTNCYSIIFEKGKPCINHRHVTPHPVVFKTQQLAEEFIKNFEYLLMIAKPLL